MSSAVTKEAEFVRLLWVDCAGITRCRVIPKERLEEVAKTGIGLAKACLFLPSCADRIPTYEPVASVAGECRLFPDMTTIQQLPWRNNEYMVLTHLRVEADEAFTDWDCCPRRALAHAVDAMKMQTGLTLTAGFECEFNLLRDLTSLAPIDETAYCQTLAYDGAVDVLHDICCALTSLGEAVEQLHAESAPGQFEIVTGHRPAMEAADSLVYRKEAIKSVAGRHGLVATFVPKLWECHAGNGCHCHFSLIDADGRPANGDIARSYGISEAMESFAAGVLANLPALLLFTAGNPASFYRIAPSTWSGSYQCWGLNNREASLRLVGDKNRPETINFELKTSDATANPHLALAAIIAAGMDGMRRSLKLPDPVQIDPERLGRDQRERMSIERLPETSGKAFRVMENYLAFNEMFNEIVGSRTLYASYCAVKKEESDSYGNGRFDDNGHLLNAQEMVNRF